MEERFAELKEKNKRPIRSKRYNRRSFGEDRRPPKRLFTPEIKRFLKDWLVRRRENPYPNRDEKKALALQTGLTYIQVCNWFANWRRKLKNAGKEPQKHTWGHLIKSYNSQVQGNVEHFSICSDDSIWNEGDVSEYNLEIDAKFKSLNLKVDPFVTTDHCYLNKENANEENQCFFVSSSTDYKHNPFSQCNGNKYKNHIIEKYWRDCQKPENQDKIKDEEGLKASMISKWLESAANFKPNENSYLHWTLTKTQQKKKSKKIGCNYQQHGREELDAAEALTTLANAYSKKN